MANSTHTDTNIVSYIFAVPIALLGLFVYIILLYLIHKSERYHNALGVLCTAYVSFHIQTVSILLLWNVIKIIEKTTLISLPWRIIIRISSPIANSTVYATIWMQLILAVNRLLAILYPLTYHHIFNPRNARITVVSLWSFSMLTTTLYYNVECIWYFEADVYSWSTLYGPCYYTFLAYIATFLSDGIILITVIVNAIAFYRIVAYLKEKRRQEIITTQESLDHDIVFFKETCVTTITHAFLIAIFRIVRIDGPFSSRGIKIMYMWLIMSTLDG